MKKIKKQGNKDTFISTIMELYYMKESIETAAFNHNGFKEKKKLENIEKSISEVEKELNAMLAFGINDNK